MRFLLDQCLSPRLARLLADDGHDAIHVRELGLSAAEDSEIILRAESADRILLSADSDFASILTLGGKSRPSCILFRGEFRPEASQQARALLANLAELGPHLERGALVVITKSRVRVRHLPVRETDSGDASE